jgi:hypothetical protein
MLVYIDETGDHNLLHIDDQYPLFGLGALLISEDEYHRMDKEVQAIKKEYFNDEDGKFILHSSELKRPLNPKSDERNVVMMDPIKRAAFYKDFDKNIIKGFKFSIMACFIRKKLMVDTYRYPADPYHFSFENLLNRIITYGGDMNVIHAERRGSELDTELLSEYERLAKTGIHSYTADVVRDRTVFKIVDKKENVNGLQVIDLILSCIARQGMGKGDKMPGNDLSPSLVEAKYACPPTIFPVRRRK